MYVCLSKYINQIKVVKSISEINKTIIQNKYSQSFRKEI